MNETKENTYWDDRKAAWLLGTNPVHGELLKWAKILWRTTSPRDRPFGGG